MLLKMGKFNFLHHFSLSCIMDTQIPKGDLDLVNSDKFDDFP